MDNQFVADRNSPPYQAGGFSFSDIGQALSAQVNALRIPPSPGSLQSPNVVGSLEGQLFDATANVKVLTSQIAMHMSREWRDVLFRQLDSLHDPEEWDPEDAPIQKASFATFLKAIFQLAPKARPGLGLSYRGYLLAAWVHDSDRLTIEFLPNDRVRWVISKDVENEPERFAGDVHVARLVESLKPYEPQRWLI
jgi:hypothetical protein